MSYETATNRELNLRMAELLGLEVNLDKTNMLDGMLVGLRDVIDDIDDDHAIFIDGDFVDYCTDWNATMPLAVEYGVGVCKGTRWMASSLDISDPFASSHFIHYDKNPLRAIVICLIKALEAKK